MAEKKDVRNWARKLNRGQRLDSTEKQKVMDTARQTGQEGKTVAYLVANGKLPNGVVALPGENV
ncbi:MAG: hypothetical protein V4611_03655 [Patescibacteria group bacterium]